jgi:hypothetical protein
MIFGLGFDSTFAYGCGLTAVIDLGAGGTSKGPLYIPFARLTNFALSFSLNARKSFICFLSRPSSLSFAA